MFATTSLLWASTSARHSALVAAGALALAWTPVKCCWGQASGDFNSDGFADLAIGVPGEDIGDPDAGAVAVLYGGASGLSAAGDQLWHQESPDIAGDASEGDRFGAALAVGDFNGDGFDDLAIGLPGDEINGVDNAGSLTILFGSSSGLISGGNQHLHLGYLEMPLDLDGGHQFGAALASGDFDNDGFDDLAVGAPAHDEDSTSDAGAVAVLFGSPGGLDTFSSIGLTQSTPGLGDTPESGDRFGAALATGNFNGDAFDDLVIGAPGETLLSVAGAGGVHVLYGSFIGPDPADSQFWSQDSNNIADQAEAGDGFGSTLAAGDFDADTFDDLAIGVPGEDRNGSPALRDAGLVHLLFGRDIGLRPAGNRLISQAAGGGSVAERGDRFGAALAFGDFDGDAADDLLIAAPGESLQDVGGGQDVQRGGAAFIVAGNALRLMTFASASLSQDGAGGLNRARNNDQFGASVALGDFNGDGRDDAAIGIPLKNVSTKDAGAVASYHGQDSAAMLGPVAGGLWTQNSTGIANAADRDDHFGGANTSP